MAATSRIVCSRLLFSEKESKEKRVLACKLLVLFCFCSFPFTKSLKQAVSRTEREARGNNYSSEYCLLDVHSVCVQFTVCNTAFLRVSRKT